MNRISRSRFKNNQAINSLLGFKKHTSIGFSRANKSVKIHTFSKRPKDIGVARFLSNPTVSLLNLIIQKDVENWDVFVKKHSNSHDREILKQEQDQCGLDKKGSKLSFPFEKQSYLSQILQTFSSPNEKETTRTASLETIQMFFTLLRKLPLFLKNGAVEIVLHFSLSTPSFLLGLQDGFNLKNSSQNTYLTGVKSIGRILGFNDVELFKRQLFLHPSPISDIEISEACILHCHKGEWLGITGKGYISGLKHLGRHFNSTRFSTPYWSQIQKLLVSSFLNRRSDKLLKKDLTPQIAIKLYYILISLRRLREAEYVRFLSLTGQRNIDYRNLRPSDIIIMEEISAVKILWFWGKTRKRNHYVQYTLLPYGTTGDFFDIYTCVQRLLALVPKRHRFLLRFSKTTQIAKIRELFNLLPISMQPNCQLLVTPYYFKNLLAIVVTESGCIPEVICHYLKHTLTREEWRELCKSGHVSSGHLTQHYALQTDYLPQIKRKLGNYWKSQ